MSAELETLLHGATSPELGACGVDWTYPRTLRVVRFAGTAQDVVSETESPSEYTLFLDSEPFASVDTDSDSSRAIRRTAPGLAFSCAGQRLDAANKRSRPTHRIGSARKMADFETVVFMNMPELRIQRLIGTFGQMLESRSGQHQVHRAG